MNELAQLEKEFGKAEKQRAAAQTRLDQVTAMAVQRTTGFMIGQDVEFTDANGLWERGRLEGGHYDPPGSFNTKPPVLHVRPYTRKGYPGERVLHLNQVENGNAVVRAAKQLTFDDAEPSAPEPPGEPTP